MGEIADEMLEDMEDEALDLSNRVWWRAMKRRTPREDDDVLAMNDLAALLSETKKKDAQ